MTKLPLAVLAVAALGVCASAQSFESAVADASASAARAAKAVRAAASAAKAPAFAAQGAPTGYAVRIDCANPPKASGLPPSLRFYTRLDGNASRVRTDETAAGLDDYRRSYLRGREFHYDAWSCDTQDYWFTFDAQSLMRTTAGEASRAVKGHARIETRGEVDWEGDLDCVATF
jgi:hypothetical protein